MTVTIDDASMVAHENMALVRSLFEMSNNRQSDPAWLEKSIALFAADAEVIDIPSGATLSGPDGIKRLLLFFLVENFPDQRVELTNVFATQDQAVLEGTGHWNDTASAYLPAGALPGMRRTGELRCCFVSQIRGARSPVSTSTTICSPRWNNSAWFLHGDRSLRDLASPFLVCMRNPVGNSCRVLFDYLLLFSHTTNKKGSTKNLG